MTAHITFENKDEVLQLIERGDEISQHFTNSGAVERCPLIFQNSAKSRFIAKGVQGSVSTFSLGIPGDRKDYVVKKALNRNYVVSEHTFSGHGSTNGSERTTLGKFYGGMSKDFKTTPAEMFYSINGGSENTTLNPGDKYFLITNKAEGGCKSTAVVVYEKWWYESFYDTVTKKNMLRSIDTGERFEYPKGSYLCKSDAYTEYAIQLMCAQLSSSGKCVNFIDLFGFSMCAPPTPDEKTGKPGVYDYTFMEMVQGSVRKNLKRHSFFGEELVDSIIIQTYFAISTMQRVLGIQHNDLHNDNVMFQDIYKANGEVMFAGQNLRDADYFSYEIDGTVLYFRNLGVIAKIADFGFAMKYSSPIVGPQKVAEGYHLTIPPWRDDYYDLTYNIGDMYDNFKNDSRLVNVLMCTIFDPWFDADAVQTLDDAKMAGEYIWGKLYDLYYQDGGRPSFVGLARHPWEYLVDPAIMGSYLDPPPAGSVVMSLGVLKSTDYFEGYFDGNAKPLKLFSSEMIDRIYKPARSDQTRKSGKRNESRGSSLVRSSRKSVRSNAKGGKIRKTSIVSEAPEVISDASYKKIRKVLKGFLAQFTELEGSGDTQNIGNLLLDLKDYLFKRKKVWSLLSSGSQRARDLLDTANLAINVGMDEMDLEEAAILMNPGEIDEIDELNRIVSEQLKSLSKKKTRSDTPDSLKTPKRISLRFSRNY